MKPIYLFTTLFTLAFGNFSIAQPQEMAQNFENTGFIQNIKLSEKTMIVNFVDKKSNTIYHESIKLDNTVYTDHNNKPLTIDSLSSSDEITIIGDQFSKYCVANKIIREEKSVGSKRKGRIDYINGDIAVVDGIKVKLAAKTKIKGKKKTGFDDRPYTNFQDTKNPVIPGILVEYKGKMKSNSLFVSDDFVIEPDNDDAYDERALKADKENYDKFKAVWSDKSKRNQLFNTKIEDIGTVVNDAELQEYVNSVGQKLVPEYLRYRVTFMFIVVDNPDTTANVRANGLAYVYTGLLKALDNEAQLAAVLGHEIAHVLYKHSADNLSAAERAEKTKKNAGELSKLLSKGKEMAEKELSDKTRKKLGLDAKKMAELEKLNKFNKSKTAKDLKTSWVDKRTSQFEIDQELQADRVGMALMVLANYDPREAPIVWKNLIGRYEEEEENKPSVVKTTFEKEYKKGKTTTAAKGKKPVAAKKTEEDEVTAGVDDMEATSTAEKALSFFIQLSTDDNINKSYTSTPDEVERFEEMNRLVSAVWDGPEIYKYAQNTNGKKYQAMKKKLKSLNKAGGKK